MTAYKYKIQKKHLNQPKLVIGQSGNQNAMQVSQRSDNEIIRQHPLEEEEELLQPKLRMKPKFQGSEPINPKSNAVTVVNKINPIIQRETRPATSTVANLETYGEKTRQKIKYDAGFNMQSDVNLYFQKGIIMDVRKGYDVEYVVKGFPTTESWVEGPMKAVALYAFRLDKDAKESVIENITTVQHLDLSGQSKPSDSSVKGPDANIRFTSTRFDKPKGDKSGNKFIQLLIEKLSDFKASTSTEKAEDRRKRFAKDYQIYNTAPESNDPLNFDVVIKSMSSSEYDKVLEAINSVPKTILNKVKGIPIHKGTTDLGTNNELGEYKQSKAKGSNTWERKIIVYKDFFKKNAEQRAFTMIHELGHAVDFRPNEGTGGKGGASLSKDSKFRDAVKDDGGLGKGVSTYDATEKDYSEYYAESFTMYFNQPDTLKALRPKVYEFFKTNFP